MILPPIIETGASQVNLLFWNCSFFSLIVEIGLSISDNIDDLNLNEQSLCLNTFEPSIKAKSYVFTQDSYKLIVN